MTRLEELTLQSLDHGLSSDEGAELDTLLLATPANRQAYLHLLELESTLRGRRANLDLAGPTLEQIRCEISATVESRAMQQIRSAGLVERNILQPKFRRNSVLLAV